MADKVAKPKKSKSKAKKDEKGVLAALPSTRPERIGSRRDANPASAKPAKPAKPAAAKVAKPAARAPAPAGRGDERSEAGSSYPRKPAAAKKQPARATAARRKAVAPRTFEPTEAAEAAAGVTAAARPRPRAVREGAPGMGTTSPDRDQPSDESGRPSGVELVTTAVQAAGEITQIGLTIGGRIIKRAVDRLPRP